MNPATGNSPTDSVRRCTVIRRTDRSLLMSVLQAAIRPLRPRLVAPKQADSSSSPRLSPPKGVRKCCDITERQVDGIWVYDLKAESRVAADAESPSRRVIYFSGGGWQMPPSPSHWALATEMVRRLPNTIVSMVAHPMAPKYPASATMPRLRELYDTLMSQAKERGEHVVFAGDSSGANIALCLVTWALSRPGSQAPAAIMAVCPTTDLRHADPGLQEAEASDPLQTLDFIKSTAQAWSHCNPDNGATGAAASELVGEHDWSFTDARVSPIFAPLQNLVARGVKLYGVIGTHDLLGLEAVAFRERCQEDGVEGGWLEWDKQMHCFPLAFKYGLKESNETVDWIAGALHDV